MEATENRNSPIPLPEVLSVDVVELDKRPTAEDWKLVQGGMPEVVPVIPEKGFFHVIHRYVNTSDPSGTGAIIPTSAPLVDKWPVRKILMTMPDGRKVQFPTALLWKYHGKGCESRSGVKYDRVKVDVATK